MAMPVWEEALDASAREEIYRFRFAQYFAEKADLPGLQREARRVWLPHDERSRHFLARAQNGRPAAVASATPAAEPLLCREWRELFGLDRLEPLLPHLVLISRVIVAREARHSALFGQFCLRLARLFLESGFHYAAHYCAPGMVSLYERLGYRQYGHGLNLGGGPFRLPMLLVADDAPYLNAVRSPFRILHSGGSGALWRDKAMRVCPELAEFPPCAMTDAAWTERIRSLCPALADLPQGSVRALKRGALLPLRGGDILAPRGLDEGAFMIVKGALCAGSSSCGPGSVVRTGAAEVAALEDSLVLTMQKTEVIHVGSAC